MPNTKIIIAIFFLCSLLSCHTNSGKIKSELVLNTLDKQLKFNNDQFVILLRAQISKMSDPYIAVATPNWKQVVEKMDWKRTQFITRTEEILKKVQSEQKSVLGKEMAKEITKYLLESKNYIKTSLIELQYKNELLKKEAIEESLNISRNFLMQIKDVEDYQSRGSEMLIEQFTKDLSTCDSLTARLVLTSLATNYVNTLHQLLYFVYSQSTYHILRCEKNIPLVSVNSTTFSPGETIEITAGIGRFDDIYQPKFMINGKAIAMNDKEPIIVSKSIVSTKKGKHFIRFEAEYTIPDGTKETITKMIGYTVK